MTEIITNREKEFCNEVTVELYKAMKLNLEAGCQFPTFYFQEKMANRTIDQYLKQIFELTTTDWEIYSAPLMFSYNTSFNRTFSALYHFWTACQAASIQSWKLGEEASWRISRFMSISQHLMNSNQNSGFFLKDNQNQWGSPFQIVKIKLHNTVKIKTGLKTNILVHIKNLKPFKGSNSRNFSSNFQKQGVDASNFDHSKDEDEKFERSDMKVRRDKQRPKEQYKEDDEDPTKVP